MAVADKTVTAFRFGLAGPGAAGVNFILLS